VRLAEIWRSISNEEKKPYIEKAAADRVVYAQKLKEYHLKMGYD